MDGYVARKGNRWYAVIYHGLDPVTGREQRTWHAAGTDREAAERLAHKFAKETVGRDDGNRSLTFRCLPHATLAPSQKDRTRTDHVPRIPANRPTPRLTVARQDQHPSAHSRPTRSALHPQTRANTPTDGGRPLSRKSVLEIHGVIRGALGDALVRRIINRNVA